VTLGRVASLTVWPVKSMSGATSVPSVWADRRGLVGDRRHAVVDRRPLRAGHVVSARNLPGLLRWRAGYPTLPAAGTAGEPVVLGPDGRSWNWSGPGLADALSDDLGVPVGLRGDPAGFADLPESVLITTLATHADVERRFGRSLQPHRWRTNLDLDLDLPAYAEEGWEGGRLTVGDVVLRLLRPCQRCTIPTWDPNGTERTPELLRWLLSEHTGCFGINARVEVPGVLRTGASIRLEPGP